MLVKYYSIWAAYIYNVYIYMWLYIIECVFHQYAKCHPFPQTQQEPTQIVDLKMIQPICVVFFFDVGAKDLCRVVFFPLGDESAMINI